MLRSSSIDVDVHESSLETNVRGIRLDTHPHAIWFLERNKVSVWQTGRRTPTNKVVVEKIAPVTIWQHDLCEATLLYDVIKVIYNVFVKAGMGNSGIFLCLFLACNWNRAFTKWETFVFGGTDSRGFLTGVSSCFLILFGARKQPSQLGWALTTCHFYLFISKCIFWP